MPGEDERRGGFVRWVCGFAAMWVASACAARSPDGASGSGATDLTTPPAGDRDASPIEAAREATFIAIGPAELEPALAPLFVLRKSQGLVPRYVALPERVDAAWLTSLIDALATTPRPGGEPRYVLVIGDTPFFRASQGSWADGMKDAATFPTDHPLERTGRSPVAVGRLPARSRAELDAMVRKLVRYEAEAPGGAWQNDVWVFGGPANFGPVADALIEAQATSLLDEFLPHEYDVGVLFANERSPYAYRFDRLGSKLVSSLNAGALIGVYAGHGQKTAFDRLYHRDRQYSIGGREDLDALSIDEGSSLFVSLTCHTGSFGLPEPSIAERMISGEEGPVAVLASSEVSHPYPNLLLGRALIASILIDRRLTLGEAVLSAKAKMIDEDLPFAGLFVPGDIGPIKADHLSLYNLFGDPATRLRLPPRADFRVSRATLSPGEAFNVVFDARAEGRVVVLETERSALKPGLVQPSVLEALPTEEAFLAMEKNHAIALDKIVSSASPAAATLEVGLVAPREPGRYWVKVREPRGRDMAHGALPITVTR